MTDNTQDTAAQSGSQAIVYNVPQSWHDEYAAMEADLRRRAANGDEDARWKLWLASDECSTLCRAAEVERLEDAGEIIGGLS